MNTPKQLSPKRGNLETKLQIAVCSYIQYALPEVLFFAVPNGGKRGEIEGMMLKRMGVRLAFQTYYCSGLATWRPLN